MIRKITPGMNPVHYLSFYDLWNSPIEQFVSFGGFEGFITQRSWTEGADGFVDNMLIAMVARYDDHDEHLTLNYRNTPDGEAYI